MFISQPTNENAFIKKVLKQHFTTEDIQMKVISSSPPIIKYSKHLK
jgi:hypothetical protein